MLRIDIWSDVVCPFCYIGKRSLENAAQAAGAALDVHWHAYELDPGRPAVATESLTRLLARKYGWSEQQAEASQLRIAEMAKGVGIAFNWRAAKPGNTRDVHRVIKLAEASGKASEAEERFFRAYMTEGEAIGERETVIRIGATIGLGAEDLRTMLNSPQFVDEVERDEALGRESYGIQGVPYFVIANKYAISGAQPVEVFTSALHQVMAEQQVEAGTASSAGPACDDGSCPV
jgi:predicted DsbA family dithiol-disulfide isomerase